MDIDITPRDNGQLPPNIVAAIGHVYAGVTIESAARLAGCKILDLHGALATPEAQLIEPTSEWDSVDLLAADFHASPDILDGIIPVGLTLLCRAQGRQNPMADTDLTGRSTRRPIPRP